MCDAVWFSNIIQVSEWTYLLVHSLLVSNLISNSRSPYCHFNVSLHFPIGARRTIPVENETGSNEQLAVIEFLRIVVDAPEKRGKNIRFC